jgi:hypothetical protein
MTSASTLRVLAGLGVDSAGFHEAVVAADALEEEGMKVSDQGGSDSGTPL